MPSLLELSYPFNIMQMATLTPQGSVASSDREPEWVTPEGTRTFSGSWSLVFVAIDLRT
jgi:hypothetical protein